jgi:hypothetical protein
MQQFSALFIVLSLVSSVFSAPMQSDSDSSQMPKEPPTRHAAPDIGYLTKQVLSPDHLQFDIAPRLSHVDLTEAMTVSKSFRDGLGPEASKRRALKRKVQSEFERALASGDFTLAQEMVNLGSDWNLEPMLNQKYRCKLTPYAERGLADDDRVEDLTPLVCAAQAKNVDAFELFVKRGADVTEKDEGYTLMHTAVIFGSIDLMKTMFELDPEQINSRDNDEKTPLHHAADQIYFHSDDIAIEMIDWLVAHGADINPAHDDEDELYSTPLQLAMQSNWAPVVARLQELSAAQAPQ